MKTRDTILVVLPFGLILGLINSISAQINVSNYGALGDLLTLSNINVVSNSPFIECPSANFLSSDTNKLIEIFNAGIWRGTSNEALVAVIAAVSSPTSATLSVSASTTANGLSACYGTDNTLPFSNAVYHCAIPTDTITIPTGNYLLIKSNINSISASGACSDVVLRRGGISWVGLGNVVLTGTGGWRDNSAGFCCRGMIFEIQSPMINRYPVSFSNITFYGGIPGLITNRDYPAHPDTGQGWDGTHHAIGFTILTAGSTSFPTNISLLGCTFHGWRGEMLINGNDSVTEFMTASNCVFYDGNATAFNINTAHDWNYCTISNMFQVEEFYRDYTSMPSVMRNCIITNLTGNAIALNGSYYGCPTYSISNNTLYGSSETLFLETTPACDVLVASNRLVEGQGIALGVSGYQDGFGVNNSNIVIAFNYFTNCYCCIEIEGSSQNSVQSVQVISNTFDFCAHIGTGYGYSTNVVFLNNIAANLVNPGFFIPDQLQGQYCVDTGNQYTPYNYDKGIKGATNIISYGRGRLAQVGGYPQVYGLDDNVAKIPTGATLWITNASPQTCPIYSTSSLSNSFISLSAGQTITLGWINNAWVMIQGSPLPPTGLRVTGSSP